jgi:hypothetical protein
MLWNVPIFWPNCDAGEGVGARRFVGALRRARPPGRQCRCGGVEHLQRVDEPLPFGAEQLESGTRQFSKITSLVSLARMPSLSSFLPARKPGVPRSTMNAEMPRDPLPSRSPPSPRSDRRRGRA